MSLESGTKKRYLWFANDIFILGTNSNKLSYASRHRLLLLNETKELKDAKSRLQEALQANGSEPPSYLVVSNKEGNHFDCSVTFNGKTFQASAALKKESEQRVAELILLELDQS